jgi:UDP-N-acetylglucosamine diphosphorylase / glucose-1-phosphate thymidylyltransferase / UDP-N-acetylgalactosamine diphosphorylase / glucosamine-1-phosphate N-acetyltransferase / galactosamine-1-phosphate N-acetyltransferase
MKAIVLAGGRGKRLGQLTESINKCMLDFRGKPVIEFNLERAASLDETTEIIIVVGNRAEDIINRYGISFMGKSIRYVIQWEQKGLVHAISCCTEALGSEDFFLLLGDEILINSRHREMHKRFRGEGLFGICGVTFQEETEKICRTYAVISDSDDRVFRLIEKPKKVLNNYQGTGHCIFRNEILGYIDRTPTHPERGEKELPDLIQCAVDDGQAVKIFNICDIYTNINSMKDLEEAQGINP